jgi:hypothetical protein
VIAALIVALGLLCQWRIGFNNDNAWLLYIARRSLDGQVLYRDLVEINPPALIWFDQAVVRVARLLHADPVFVFRTATAGLTFLCAWWSSRLLRTAGFGRRVLPALLFVLLLLPVSWFGQREHFVLLLVIPLLCLAVARESGAASRWVALTCGLVAGLGFGVKPQYLTVWLLLLIFQARSRRTWRVVLAPEHLGVVASGAFYLVAVLAFAPHYLPLVRRLGALYADYRAASLPYLIAGDFAPLVILLALATLLTYRKVVTRGAAQTVLLLATVGFYLGALLQGKGFDYHYYPALASALLLLLVGAPLAGGATATQRRGRTLMLALALIGSAPYVLAAGRIGVAGDDPEMRAYRELERAVGPVRGRPILVLSARSGFAFGLVTYAGAEWVGGFPCLWVPSVLNGGETRAALGGWFRESVIRAAESDRPIVVLVSPPGGPAGPADMRLDLLQYLSSDPRFRRFMAGYQPDGEAAGYRIYRRRITAVESRYQVVQP